MGFNLDDMKAKIMLLADSESDYTQEDFNLEFGSDSLDDLNNNNIDNYKIKLDFVNKSNNQNPEYATKGSSGFDLRASLTEPIIIDSGKYKLIPTGLYFNIPENMEIQIRSRSGLAAKDGVCVLNSPGTIDCVPKGTKISSPDGYVLIEDIFNSDKKEIILSYNEETGEIENDVVSDIWVVENLELIKIVTEENDVLIIPITKEVLTENGWKIAKYLTIDDKILKIT